MVADAIRVELVGPPRGKGRPRFVRATGHAYTDEKTRKYEDALRYAAGEAMAGRPPLDCALNVDIQVFLPVPESWSGKKKREALAGVIRPTGKPDWDNYIKGLDAFNMVVWRDDAQVVLGSFAKRYSDRPRFVVTVWPVPAPYLDHETGEVRDVALPLLERAS